MAHAPYAPPRSSSAAEHLGGSKLERIAARSPTLSTHEQLPPAQANIIRGVRGGDGDIQPSARLSSSQSARNIFDVRANAAQKRSSSLSSASPALLASRSVSGTSKNGHGLRSSTNQLAFSTSSNRLAQSTSSTSIYNNLPSPSMPYASSAGPKYDNKSLAAAIERAEHRADNRLEAKPGDVGLVGAVGFGGGDEWQNVCVRVLPLFNGEGVKGYIEDLNDLVSRFIRRLADRSPTKCVDYLAQHLVELLATGMLTITDKFHADVDDQFLLYQLNQLWTTFYTTTLPYLEAIFLPFSIDPHLKRATSNFTPYVSEITSNTGAPIDVRRLTLSAFRGHVVLPLVERLAPLLARDALPPSRRSSAAHLTPSASTQSLHDAENPSKDGRPRLARMNSKLFNQTDATSRENQVENVAKATRMQMVLVLTTIQSNDTYQDAIEMLSGCLRGLYSVGELERRVSGRSVSTYKPRQSHDRPAFDLGPIHRPYTLAPDDVSPEWSDTTDPFATRRGSVASDEEVM